MQPEELRWHGVADRVERLLDRVERLAARLEPSPPSPPPFEDCLAFRWTAAGRSLLPVRHPHLVDHRLLVGIDDAKEELFRNTRQFVMGLPANNVLLWGERGMGKSSLVKAALAEFAPRGLRLVAVQAAELSSLPLLLDQLRDRPYRFILFCDDLSFTDTGASFRELKTLLEGGVEERPANILLYATSNRRHLVPEPMAENLGGEIHPEEAVSDRISLADRFGIRLGFYRFDQETYLTAVRGYAAGAGLAIADGELRKEALRWALYRGERSGRTARQFVDDLTGRVGLAGEAERSG